MKKLVKLSITIILSALCIVHFGFCPTALAKDPICEDSQVPEKVKEARGCNGNENALPAIITNILYAIIAVSGLVAVIYIIIGGINYMTSAGDTTKLEKAKKTILYALIGLVISVLAFAIVNWTIGAIG